MNGVGGHGSEDGDHERGQPVDPWNVAADGELQRHGQQEGDEAADYGDVWVKVADQVVGSAFAERRGDDFDSPENDGDGGNFGEGVRGAGGGSGSALYRSLDG